MSAGITVTPTEFVTACLLYDHPRPREEPAKTKPLAINLLLNDIPDQLWRLSDVLTDFSEAEDDASYFNPRTSRMTEISPVCNFSLTWTTWKSWLGG
jgi:hypothetical protein